VVLVTNELVSLNHLAITLVFMKKLIFTGLYVLLSVFVYARDNGSLSPVLLPSKFINGERFYMKIGASTGDTILGFGDTGGGMCFMPPATVEKLGIQSKIRKGFVKHLVGVNYIEFRKIVADDRIPSPLGNCNLVLTRHFRKVKRPFFTVPALTGEFKDLPQMLEVLPFDVFLAQEFFMGKSWTFDYINRQIWVNTPITLSDTSRTNVQKLGFKKDENGVKLFGHPSMKIIVDGDTIDVLFDTGATIILSEDVKKKLNIAENTIGGSFIAKSVFERWRTRHPEWTYIEKGDRNTDIIEVPNINIGGHIVGPVLFSERPDEAWSVGMIHTMDKVVKGAIGGSALKYLKVTIDYNSELIKFE
jgi:hypothetical protein